MQRKYTVLPEVVRGKRVFLVEDSIVRSTTLRVIVKMLKNAPFQIPELISAHASAGQDHHPLVMARQRRLFGGRVDDGIAPGRGSAKRHCNQ